MKIKKRNIIITLAIICVFVIGYYVCKSLLNTRTSSGIINISKDTESPVNKEINLVGYEDKSNIKIEGNLTEGNAIIKVLDCNNKVILSKELQNDSIINEKKEFNALNKNVKIIIESKNATGKINYVIKNK